MIEIEEINFETKGNIQILDITPHIESIVRNSRVKNGFIILFAPHATGIIGITEFDPQLIKDIEFFLEKFIPSKSVYNHPDNAFSHLRSLVFGTEKIIPLINGNLSLGTWQSVIWVETDTGPRSRKIIIQIIGE